VVNLVQRVILDDNGTVTIRGYPLCVKAVKVAPTVIHHRHEVLRRERHHLRSLRDGHLHDVQSGQHVGAKAEKVKIACPSPAKLGQKKSVAIWELDFESDFRLPYLVVTCAGTEAPARMLLKNSPDVVETAGSNSRCNEAVRVTS